MIVVSPLGFGTSPGRPADARRKGQGYTKILFEEVMPTVDRAYNVSRNREQRAMAGLSMGGAEWLLHRVEQPRQVRVDRRLQLRADAVAGAAPPRRRPQRRRGPRRGADKPAAMDEAGSPRRFRSSMRQQLATPMMWIVCGTGMA